MTFTLNKNNPNIKTDEHICIFSLDQLARSYHKPRILLAATEKRKQDSNEAQDRNQFVFNQYILKEKGQRVRNAVIFTDARCQSATVRIVLNYCCLIVWE